MVDNLHRAIQDINIIAEDSSFILPAEVVAANQFVIIDGLVIPQIKVYDRLWLNLLRIWGLVGNAHGRIIECKQFQFVFSYKKALEWMIKPKKSVTIWSQMMKFVRRNKR
ncbi:unnamed protein product, partial [Thlaspi arvense]